MLTAKFKAVAHGRANDMSIDKGRNVGRQIFQHILYYRGRRIAWAALFGAHTAATAAISVVAHILVDHLGRARLWTRLACFTRLTRFCALFGLAAPSLAAYRTATIILAGTF